MRILYPFRLVIVWPAVKPSEEVSVPEVSMNEVDLNSSGTATSGHKKGDKKTPTTTSGPRSVNLDPGG